MTWIDHAFNDCHCDTSFHPLYGMKCRLIPRPILERLQTCRRVVFDFRGKIKLLWIFSFLSVKEKYFGICIEITLMCLGLPCM